MQVKRFNEAKPYEAPNHRGYSSLRLFGARAGGPKNSWSACRNSCPAAAPARPSPPEKVYFVLAGELTVIVDGRRPC